MSDPKVIDDQRTKPVSQKEHEEAKAAKQLSHLKDQRLTMTVKVSSPFTTYFSGSAFSISGLNATGPFDILPGHHKFISLLQACTLTIRTPSGEEQKIDISGGLLHVKADKVSVFLDV